MGPRVRYVDIEGARSVAGSAAVVVDVMRAFTTAAWAFHRGAGRVVLLGGLDEALALKAATPGALAFCDGEPKPGFDLHNSPVQLLDLDVAGRTICQRTGAGTQGAVAARGCEPILCTGFVTAAATAAFVRAAGVDDVTFVVTGGDEDQACAEHIAALLDGRDPGAGFVERARRSGTARKLMDDATIRRFPGVHPGDVDTCLEVDRFSFAMRAREEDGLLVLRPVEP